MPTLRRPAIKLTGPQAQYVLAGLLSEKRIRERDIRVHMENLGREIESLESRLNVLRDAAERPRRSARSSAEGSNGQPKPTAAPKRRRLPNLSPERRAALTRQGHYLALMRQTPKTKRAHFTKIFKTKGGAAAIDALRKSLGK